MKTPLAVGILAAASLFATLTSVSAQLTGVVDNIDASGNIYGWAADAGNPGAPVSIHVYVDALDAAHFAGLVEPRQIYDRSDVWQFFNWKASNHGFFFTIPNSSPNDPNVAFNFRNNVGHHVYVFVIGPNGNNALIGDVYTPALSNLSVSLSQPLSANGNFWIGPNQAAASIWWNPPAGQGPVNGHLEESFAHFDYWPSLNAAMRQRNDGYGTGAPEIGHLYSSTLSKFRAANMPVTVDTPSFTQCYDGKDLARLDFYGQSPPGEDLLCSRFNFCQPNPERQDPHNAGWFKTRDGQIYTPEEIILDERIPNLRPGFDIATILNGSIPWEQRKAQARQDSCPTAAGFNPEPDRISGLINDYVEYADAMKLFFAPNPAPRLSLHWNVVVWWEWGDESWLDQLHASVPEANFPNAVLYVQNPSHHDTQYLAQLVETMCARGTCPDTVYMDVDYLYLTSYAVDVLKRNKAVLEAHNVKFGLDLVDACTDETRRDMLNANPPRDCVVTSPDGNSLQVSGRDPAQYSPNALYEESVINLTNFLVNKGIIDSNTKIRLGPWGRRPIESGSGVNENNVGLAHTANRILNEYLIPRSFDRRQHYSGLSGTYFSNINFTGTTIRRTDPTVDFSWGGGSPDPAMDPTDLSVRWEGEVWAGFSETYTFYTVSDDGVRLWVNDQLLIDNWTYHGDTENSGSMTLARGQKYNIRMEYFQGAGGATAKLLWSSPSQPKQIIPEDRLSSGSGLRGTYYDNIDFTGSTITRIDPQVDLDWWVGAPDSRIGVDTFSVRWEGTVVPRYSETYTFYAGSDDGTRLWINGQLVVDNWRDQGYTEGSGAITLSAGQHYNVRLEFYENGGAARATLAWSSARQAKEIIPQSQLYPPSGGLRATYYDNIDFTGAAITRIDPQVNFNWSLGSPDPQIGPDTFSARWEGTIVPRYSETYTFYAGSDDGTRLWINGQLVVDNWGDHGHTERTGTITLNAGQHYNIQLDFYENGGGASATLSWSSPSQPKEIVPQGQLTP